MSAAEDISKLDLPPGIYRRNEVQDYGAIKAVNYSSLKMLAKSPKHYQHYLKHGRGETKSMFKGTAAHIATLEPERFAFEFAVFEGSRRAGKEWEAFEAMNADRTILKKSEYEEAFAIRDAIRADAVASSYLSNGHHEVTLVWIDDETGLKLKGRVDWLRNDNVIVDLKTTRDAVPFFFSRDVARLAYHVQAAMYLDGLEKITGKPARYVVPAVESSAPYDVVTFDVPEPVIGVGRDEYKRLLKILIECRETGRWPGIGNGFEVPLTLPAWAMGDENDLEALGLEM